MLKYIISNWRTSYLERVIVLFGEISDSYESLTPTQREALASLLTDRNVLNLQVLELNRRKIEVLRNWTPEAEQDLKDFSSIFVAPLRANISKQMFALIEEAIDKDSMKSMLPMVLMVLTQSINLPLLLTALGFETDVIDQIIRDATKYFQRGVE